MGTPAEDRAMFEINCLITKLFDRVDSLEDRVDGFYNEFIDYIEHFPKIDEQWAEQRLRGLEHQVKELRVGTKLDFRKNRFKDLMNKAKTNNLTLEEKNELSKLLKSKIENMSKDLEENDSVGISKLFHNIMCQHLILHFFNEHKYFSLCPFHEEKTPSFVIDTRADVGSYHCLSCGKTGKIINFEEDLKKGEGKCL